MNVIIHNDERRSQRDATLREYGINPERATAAQREMADCIAQNELTLNLSKLERDFDVSVDICIDKFGMLVTGLGVKYAAQIEIPARQYVDKEQVNPDYDPEDENSQKTIMVPEPVSFSMDNVTLKLYSIE